MTKKPFRKLLFATVPVWAVLLIVLDAIVLTGTAEYILLDQTLNRDLKKLASTTTDSEELVKITQAVLPQNGHTTSVQWKNIGRRLVEIGAINPAKYQDIFGGAPEMKYMESEWDEAITINENNSRFIVNTLWAFGLVNKSLVLDETPKLAGRGQVEKLASTGGWTLSSKPVMKIYNSEALISLTREQQELVKRIAENVFRPCCNNHTAFPDCNHGMAALGFIELAVSTGTPEERIYKDLLALNSFWFPQNYVTLAKYFEKQGTSWGKVNLKLALSREYSSAQGAAKVRQLVEPAEIKNQGGGCGA